MQHKLVAFWTTRVSAQTDPAPALVDDDDIIYLLHWAGR